MPIQSRSATPLFQVFDMRRSVAWYCDMLGFEVVQSYEPDGHLYWAMLQLGDATLMLNSQYEDEDRPAQEPPSPPGHSDVTLYFDWMWTPRTNTWKRRASSPRGRRSRITT
jgi:glyoxylase I family protein